MVIIFFKLAPRKTPLRGGYIINAKRLRKAEKPNNIIVTAGARNLVILADALCRSG
jgi:hypothetical protein